ncbi:MAG: LON peptidase substrate-binding domain-containing protein [Gammaproteobacteria bacterium]
MRLATITDWDRRPDGLLVTARGERRFRIRTRTVAANNLIHADVEWFPNEPPAELIDTDGPTATLLREFVEQLDLPTPPTSKLYQDAVWVGYRLAELLPITPQEKQLFLEMNDAGQRLEQLQLLVTALHLA